MLMNGHYFKLMSVKEHGHSFFFFFWEFMSIQTNQFIFFKFYLCDPIFLNKEKK